jgi:hypothetical protein
LFSDQLHYTIAYFTMKGRFCPNNRLWLSYQNSLQITKNERQHNGQRKEDKRTNIDLQNITQKTNDQATRTPLKSKGWTEVLWKGRQFLLHMWYPPCCSCYKPGILFLNLADCMHIVYWPVGFYANCFPTTYVALYLYFGPFNVFDITDVCFTNRKNSTNCVIY